jgi:peptidoglycan-N-acetylglucosamine deacetylase
VVGKIAERNDDLLRQEYQEGHCIGNHSYHHVDLTKIPDKDVEVEWLACNEVIKSVIGITPKYCRPPGGNYDDPVIQAAMKYNLITVLWTDDPGDYAEPGKEIIEERVLYSIYEGGIILLHDGIQQTINILPGIIEHLQKLGYKFITIDEMCKQKRCELTWEIL